MKILLAFFDMVRVDHLKLYNSNAPQETAFDKLFRKIGGTLFNRCYTPAPDTPRSLACLQTGYLPFKNGCDTRIKWPKFFIKDNVSTIFDNAVSRGYNVNLCIRKPTVLTGEFKYKESDKITLSYTFDEFLTKAQFSENSLSYIGNVDPHIVVGEYGGSDYGLNKVSEVVDLYFKKYMTIDFLNQFDVVIFFSDHGLKTTKEKYTQKSKLDLLLDGRTKLLMFYHAKGDKEVRIDDRLCSMVDLYSTIEQLTGGTDMRDGFSMLQPPQRKMLHIEDHTDFSVSPEVMVKQWRVVSDKLDIRTDLNETIDENGRPADLNLILPYLKEVSPKIADLQKQYEIWEFYKKLCMPAPKYFVGEKRPSHLKTMFFKVLANLYYKFKY
ncbi:hypothetical protein [Segatella copri]|uniref:hypothetical protein n=1 Tax=Segatella copri TaxID=165179 RepID=UPI00294B4706|nr:hypothetical protein [Segatella copri]WOG32179.1 hypothetical protein RJT04_00680 [Segatella copri]